MEERILSKINDAKDNIELVRKNFPDDYEKVKSFSKLERDGLYKNIEFAIQNVLHICAIILKEEDLRVPESDESMLEELRASGVLKEETVETMRNMKGFRNYLVHRYGEIDGKTAYNNIKPGIEDFEKIFKKFRDYIKSYE